DAAIRETSQCAVDGESRRSRLWCGSMAGVGPSRDAGTHRKDCDPLAYARRFEKPACRCDREVDQRTRAGGLPRRISTRTSLRVLARKPFGEWRRQDLTNARRAGRIVKSGGKW